MMAKSLVVTCDACGAEGARTYSVSVDDHRWSVDLDDELRQADDKTGRGRPAQRVAA